MVAESVTISSLFSVGRRRGERTSVTKLLNCAVKFHSCSSPSSASYPATCFNHAQHPTMYVLLLCCTVQMKSLVVHEQNGQHLMYLIFPKCSGRRRWENMQSQYSYDGNGVWNKDASVFQKQNIYLREKALGISAWKSLKPSAPYVTAIKKAKRKLGCNTSKDTVTPLKTASF